MHVVGKEIKKMRKSIGMTQTELAKRCGYSATSMISKIENGSTDLTASKLKTIATALGCSPADLLGTNEINIDDEIQRLFSLLSDDQKKQAVDYLSFLVNRG